MSAASADDVYLTSAELAERYGLSRRTIEDWRSNRAGPKFIRLRREVRYRLSDVRRWERENEQVPA